MLYVLDLAEIPTFQAKPQRPGSTARRLRGGLTRTIGRHLALTVDGRPATLRPLRHVLAFPPGQAGLRTTRLEIVFAGPRLHAQSAVAYRDGNYAGRIGWKEVVVRPAGGAHVVSSTAPAKSVSGELLAYPKNLLQSPLDVTSARTDDRAGLEPGCPPTLLPRNVLEQRVAVRAVADGGFASLIARDRPGAGFVLVSLLDRDVLGRGARASRPATGSRSSPPTSSARAARPGTQCFSGCTVTVTHTIGVFALGLVTLSLSEFVVPDQLYPWLNLVSALLIVGVGLQRPPLAAARVAQARRARTTTRTPPPRPRPRVTTTSTTTRSARGACSASASPAGSSRARPRSSSSSPRSRSTGSATGSS